VLKAEGRTSDRIIDKLMGWHHGRFGVRVGNRIAADDRAGQMALVEYIMRNAFSDRKITHIEDADKVLYRSAMPHGNNQRELRDLHRRGIHRRHRSAY
jgi:hypothetical protein